MNRIMVLKGGSPAIHKLGNIGRENDDYIRVYDETEDYYIGNFEEGFGFVDVKFRKEDCRPLTEEERKQINGRWYSINGNSLYRIYVDNEGNVINGKVFMLKGRIDKVTDTQGNDKFSDFVGLNVTFGEDIQIGSSLVMLTNSGTIQTSKVTNLARNQDKYII
ncbi:MAG: hypothetical protein PWR08_1985, partial [Thermoanaerobacterium sp.]|nr:hypothetical protein [Thermoanaerobacterium sp.]